MINVNWEVFIAYHGSFQGSGGSKEKAREIFDFLKGQNGINCYFYPECEEGKFGNTPKEAAHSRLFLLVANRNIAGKLDITSGEIKEGEPIYEEIDAFYQNKMHLKKGSNGILRVYCYDGYRDADADLLFPVATKNVEHFDEERDGGEEKTFTKLLEWITNSSRARSEHLNEATEKDASSEMSIPLTIPNVHKGNNKIFEWFHYVFTQHSWLIISIIVLLVSIVVYFSGIITHKNIYFSVVFWMLSVMIVIITRLMSWTKKFLSMGFRKIYCSAVFGEAKPQNIMKSSKRKIRFLGIASSKWLRDESLFKETLMRLCSDDCGGMEFLLLNPNSEYAKRMDLACKSGDRLTSESINQCLDIISRIVREVCLEKGLKEIKAFSVRLYSHYPIYRIIISDDDRIFLSFYSAGISGNNNYQIKVDGHKSNNVYPCLINYYNQLWNDESTVIYSIKK